MGGAMRRQPVGVLGANRRGLNRRGGAGCGPAAGQVWVGRVREFVVRGVDRAGSGSGLGHRVRLGPGSGLHLERLAGLVVVDRAGSGLPRRAIVDCLAP